MAIVYRHRRISDDKVFYIGIGKLESRAASKHDRNNHWKNIVKKHGYYYEILAKDLDWDSACELEIFLIEQYGREMDNSGILCNMTAGGDGGLGLSRKHSDATKEKMRIKATGRKMPQSAVDITGDNMSKKVIDISTGTIYKSIRDAERKNNLTRGKIARRLTGRTVNNTSFKFLDE